MDAHCDDMVLAAYVDGDASVDRYAVEAHAARCNVCAANLEAYASIVAVLSDGNVYDFTARERLGRQTLDVKTVRRWLSGQSHEDDAVLAQLRNSPVAEWPSLLDVQPKLQTKNLTRHLAAAAHAELKRQPVVALKLCEIADSIARRHEDPLVIAEQCAEVAKERANALRVLNRHAEALDALDVAERYLSELPGSGYDMLFVEWSRATVWFAMSKYADALPLARKVIVLFGLFGDVQHVNEVRILEANIICEQGDVGSAAAIYRELLTYFSHTESVALVATLNGNLAECAVRLDHPEAAHRHAAAAAQTFEELGLFTERTRVRWTLGYELMRRGYHADALEALQTAATEFEALGMTIEAGKVGLDIVETHLRLEDWPAAEALARYLATLFSKGEAPVHFIRACSDLREAVAAKTATVEFCEMLRAGMTAVSTPSEPDRSA